MRIRDIMSTNVVDKMRIRDVMTANVITVDEETSIHDARKIMDAHKIRRLPVTRKDKLVGLVTKHMLLEAAPSGATSLNVYELHYLLAKMTVKEIMVKKPCTISPDMAPEDALRLGQERGYGAFPVVENGKLVGMVTESDIVRLMTRVFEVARKGKKITIKASNVFGNMVEIVSILDRHKTVLLSFMSIKEPDEDEWLIDLRLDSDNAEPIAKELTASGFNVIYVG